MFNCRLWGVWKARRIFMLALHEFKEGFPDNTYLHYCFEAMKELYKSIDWFCFHEEDMDDDDILVYERNYIISLASMLSKNGFNLPGMINGEVAKSMDYAASSVVKEKYIELKKQQKPDRKLFSPYIFPDFLIHESHIADSSKWTTDTQHVIFEAKTSEINKISFFLDFFKLNFYLESLHYENAVYLIVRTPINMITNFINAYEKDVNYIFEERLDHMYLFVQEKLKDEPKIYKIIKS